jgi:hypothetical protein
MVDMIIAEHGREAVARIAAAYRDGASDAEALEAGTGTDAEALYTGFYDEFGVAPPEPVEPAPILPSNVRRPDGEGGSQDGGPVASSSPTAEDPRSPGEAAVPWLAVAALVVVLAAVVGFALVSGRRAAAGDSG